MAELKLTGTVRDILPEQSGDGRNGPWRKQDFILETEGEYPKQVCMTVWGDRIDAFGIVEGETLECSIDIESREYNGRWYTDVKAWKVGRIAGARPSAVEDDPLPSASAAPSPPDPAPTVEPDDDLPF